VMPCGTMGAIKASPFLANRLLLIGANPPNAHRIFFGGGAPDAMHV
jgi:hypothetical protein